MIGRWFHFPSWLAPILVALALVLVPRVARAAPNDKEVDALVQSVFEAEYLNAQFKDALDKLELAKQACEGDACSPSVRAKVYVAIGTVLAGGFGKTAEAKKAFIQALKEDPNVALLHDYVTPDVQKAFDEARAVVSPGAATPAPTPTAPAAPSAPPASAPETTPAAPKPHTKHTFKGGRPPRGWRSAEAAFYYSEAVQAERDQEWTDCVADAEASLALEDRTTTRYLAASCEERGGLWNQALADYRVVADTGARLGLRGTAAQARARAESLRAKIPKIIVRKPARATDLVVKMDDAPVAPDKLGGELWVNPGQHTITATGKIDGVPLEFEQTVDVGEFETASIDVKLAPKSAAGTRAELKCFLEAKTREDFAKCIEPAGKKGMSLDVTAGVELSGYHDTDHVDVVSPAAYTKIESPTAGWGVGASFLVDVVTAASADIVASASPRWREVRYAPALNGHKKLGVADVGLHGSLSHEPDYLATSIGATISADLARKSITPTLGYEYSHDISGRAGTSFDVYSHTIDRHGLDAAVSFVVDKATIFELSLTAVFERGDTSKPYRYIPMFRPDIAPLVQPGQSIDSVNLYRSPERVLEQLPDRRNRWAVAGLVAHRFKASTIRAEERLYTDDWGLKATTTDARYLIDLTRSLRVWPHLRFHAQTGVDFWQLAYVAAPTTTGSKLPALRTGDRELGPLLGVTFGAGTRYALSDRWALTFNGDVVYTRFLDHLYILERFGFFGALGAEVGFR